MMIIIHYRLEYANLLAIRECKENESCMVVRHLANLSASRWNCCWAYSLRIAAIGNLWYKFVPKGYIPLRDFYQIFCEVGSPRSAQSREISPLWLLKCGLRAPEIVEIGNLSYKFAKKSIPP